MATLERYSTAVEITQSGAESEPEALLATQTQVVLLAASYWSCRDKQ